MISRSASSAREGWGSTRASVLTCIATFVSIGCGAPAQNISTASPSGADGRSTTPLEVHFERLGVEDDIDEELLEAARDRVMEDVRQRQQQRHGRLPPVSRSEAQSPDAWPVVSVRNDTPYGLVVWFAGPCPRTMALPPHGELTDDLCEGNYDVAAELASEDFLPFVGEGNQVDSGYQYTLTFYVVSNPRVRRVRARRR